MQVHVIMSNDYPDRVIKSAKAAEDFVMNKNAEDEEKERPHRRIFWRSYSFEVQE